MVLYVCMTIKEVEKYLLKFNYTHKYLIILAGTISYCTPFIQYPYILHSQKELRNVMKWFCILTMCSYFIRSIFI